MAPQDLQSIFGKTTMLLDKQILGWVKDILYMYVWVFNKPPSVASGFKSEETVTNLPTLFTEVVELLVYILQGVMQCTNNKNCFLVKQCHKPDGKKQSSVEQQAERTAGRLQGVRGKITELNRSIIFHF